MQHLHGNVALLDGFFYKFCHVGGTELMKNVFAVEFNGIGRNKKHFGNFGCFFTLCNGAEYFLFAFRQRLLAFVFGAVFLEFTAVVAFAGQYVAHGIVQFTDVVALVSRALARTTRNRLGTAPELVGLTLAGDL